jgi:hypothetical protein
MGERPRSDEIADHFGEQHGLGGIDTDDDPCLTHRIFL